MRRKGGGNGDTLALASRQGRLVAMTQRRDTQQIENLFNPLPHQEWRNAKLLHTERKFIFDACGNGLALRILEDEADHPAERPRSRSTSIMAVDRYTAAKSPT
jgi:hypothetical protein